MRRRATTNHNHRQPPTTIKCREPTRLCVVRYALNSPPMGSCTLPLHLQISISDPPLRHQSALSISTPRGFRLATKHELRYPTEVCYLEENNVRGQHFKKTCLLPGFNDCGLSYCTGWLAAISSSPTTLSYGDPLPSTRDAIRPVSCTGPNPLVTPEISLGPLSWS